MKSAPGDVIKVNEICNFHVHPTARTKKNANYAYSLITRAPLKRTIFNLQYT